MSQFKFLTVSAFVLALAACGQASTAGAHLESETKSETTMSETKMMETVDLSGAPSGNYDIEKTHAYIVFSYTHQGFSRPFLRWANWDSTLNWNAEDPTQSYVSATIPVADIDSGVDIFNEHLVSADWFNAAEHPTITYSSTSLTQTGANTGTMTGDLTIMGITKPVTLDVTFNKAGGARGGGTKLGFSASGDLLRSDWNLGKYSPSTSDEVELIIEAEYVMK